MKATTTYSPTIQVYATEQRTMVRPGEAPLTIIREVTMKNGKGRKTVKIIKGKRTISSEVIPLGPVEKRKIHRRKYVRGLYKPMERKTLKRLNGY